MPSSLESSCRLHFSKRAKLTNLRSRHPTDPSYLSIPIQPSLKEFPLDIHNIILDFDVHFEDQQEEDMNGVEDIVNKYHHPTKGDIPMFPRKESFE